MRSAEETEKNLALAIVAHALAKKVFPVPGGPYSKIPFHGCVFPPLKMNPNYRGITKASYSTFLGSFRPAMSSSYTLGLSYTIVPSSIFLSYSSSGSFGLSFFSFLELEFFSGFL